MDTAPALGDRIKVKVWHRYHPLSGIVTAVYPVRHYDIAGGHPINLLGQWGRDGEENAQGKHTHAAGASAPWSGARPPPLSRTGRGAERAPRASQRLGGASWRGCEVLRRLQSRGRRSMC
jgi:hypothetical protein